jgi:hypothetical protein
VAIAVVLQILPSFLAGPTVRQDQRRMRRAVLIGNCAPARLLTRAAPFAACPQCTTRAATVRERAAQQEADRGSGGTG